MQKAPIPFDDRCDWGNRNNRRGSPGYDEWYDLELCLGRDSCWVCLFLLSSSFLHSNTSSLGLARVFGGMSDPQWHAPASHWKDLTRDYSWPQHERENTPLFGRRRIPSEWDLRIIQALIATCSLVSLLGYVGVYARNTAHKHCCVFI